MWNYIKRCRKQNIVAFTMLFLVNLCEMGSRLIEILIMDQALGGNLKNILLILAGDLYFSIFVLWIQYEQKRTQARAIEAMNCEMRKDITGKIRKRDYQKFMEKDTGEYISWYTNDVKEAEMLGFQNIYEYVNWILLFGMNAIALFVVRWELLLLTLVISAGTFYLSKHFEQGLEELSEKVSTQMEQFTEKAKEQIIGLRVLKAFGHLKNFDVDMSDAGMQMEDQRLKFEKETAKVRRKLGSLSAAGMYSLHVILFAFAVIGKIQASVLMGGVNMISDAYYSFQQIIGMRVRLAGARPYFQKLEEQDREEEPCLQLPEVRDRIQIRNLIFAYTDRPVLKGVSLDFKMGGKYVLVGKSGCGKSTLLKLLLGQLTGYQGEILFDGKEAGQYGRDSFYQRMAYIEQNVFLFHDTIRENITMGDPFTEAELEEALQKSALLGDLDHFVDGLDTNVGENGSHLSGGQKQRVAIARALIHHRSILIVDEGTSALDQENAAAIEDTLLACQDLTVIMVSHHLREEKKKAYTAVYRLENGMQAEI